MKKLTLDPESLQVQSFTTAPEAPGRGTVRGEQCTCPTNCTCPGCPTCAATCPNTCYETCDDNTCFTCEFSCARESCDYTCHTDLCACNLSDFGSCICG